MIIYGCRERVAGKVKTLFIPYLYLIYTLFIACFEEWRESVSEPGPKSSRGMDNGNAEGLDIGFRCHKLSNNYQYTER
jgi:hypothetical protein